jgi:hypothetical protein
MFKLKPKSSIIVGISVILLGALGWYVGFGNSLGGNHCGVSNLPRLFQVGPVDFVNNAWCGNPVVIEGAGRILNYILSIILDFFRWLAPVGIYLLITGVIRLYKQRGTVA